MNFVSLPTQTFIWFHDSMIYLVPFSKYQGGFVVGGGAFGFIYLFLWMVKDKISQQELNIWYKHGIYLSECIRVIINSSNCYIGVFSGRI